jgi:hypothetical protein
MTFENNKDQKIQCVTILTGLSLKWPADVCIYQASKASLRPYTSSHPFIPPLFLIFHKLLPYSVSADKTEAIEENFPSHLPPHLPVCLSLYWAPCFLPHYCIELCVLPPPASTTAVVQVPSCLLNSPCHSLHQYLFFPFLMVIPICIEKS